MSELCGRPRGTDGEPCRFPKPGPECPFHGDGVTPPDNGRPVTYEEEVADELLERLANGGLLNRICREEGMPPPSTVRQWAYDDRDGFAARYARARRLQMDALVDEAIEIADDGRGDTWVDEDGNEIVNYDVVQRSKQRVDIRKWVASRVAPDPYGKTQRLEHSGPGGGPIETDTKTEVALENLSTDELKLLAQLRDRAGVGSANGAGP